MDYKEFTEKWESRIDDYDRKRTVGIDVNWRNISSECKVEVLKGTEAWKRIEELYPPNWNNWPRMKLSDWIKKLHPNYLEFINTEKNKLNFHGEKGLFYPEFCAFVGLDGQGILGDGNHRFIICNYLISNGADMIKEIEDKCVLDILVVPELVKIVPDGEFLV